MKFDEVMKKYINAPYDRLVSIARRSFNDVCVSVTEYFKSESDVSRFFVVAIGAAIAVDGELTELERRFARDVMGDAMDDALLDTMADMYNSVASRQMLDDVADELEEESKLHLCAFLCCFAAVDRTATHDETEFLSKLLR